ncbi:MAG: hypothetical protein ABWY19_10230 [Marmoricola sp.]
MRSRLTVVSLALAMAGTLLYAAPASAARSPFDLPRGADTTVPHLAGRTLHVGARTYPVPDQSQGGDYRVDYSLIGLDARGRWLIGVDMDMVYQPDEYYYRYGARERILAVGSAGATTVFDELSNYGAGGHFRLTRDRTRVVLRWAMTDDDSFANTDVRVIDLDGRTVAYGNNLHQSLVTLDANANRVVLGGKHGVRARVWTPGGGARWLTRRHTSFAYLRTGSLGVRGTRHRWAMTTLARPNRVRWQAWFVPTRVSPDAKRVAGLAVSRTNGEPLSIVQIRRRSDGRLVRAFSFTHGSASGATLAWVGNASVVFEARETGRSDAVLVRCGTGGSCARVSDASAASLSFAFEPDPRGW